MVISFFEMLEVHLSFLIFIFFFLGVRDRMMRNDKDSFFFLRKEIVIKKVEFNFLVYCSFSFLDIYLCNNYKCIVKDLY